MAVAWRPALRPASGAATPFTDTFSNDIFSMKNTFHQFVLTAALLLSPCQMQAQFFIGQDTLGGKVAFIDASGIHGLIAAASDQSIGMRWNNGVSTNYVLTQATNTIMYAGGANTTRIISVLGVPSSGNTVQIARLGLLSGEE